MVNKKKGGLAKRYQASFESKGSSGGRDGVMDWKKADTDIEFFSPKEGRNRINIIPYVIKSKNHPLVKKGEFEIGDKDYVMDVWVHRGVGPSEASVLCLKNTYGKPCPICEQSALLRKQGKEDEAGALKASRRVFYNVQELKEPDKLKIFEASHYLFERELIDEARDDEEGGFINFADEEEGKEIKFRCSKTSKGGFEFNEFKSFSFEERDENIPDELLEKAVSFDELLVVPTYEEAEKVLYGRDDDDEDEDDEPPAKPSKKSKKPAVEDEEEDDSDDDDEQEEERTVAKKASAKKVVEDDDEDEDETSTSKSKKKPEKVEEPDDDDEDEDDEPPAKPSKKKDGDCGSDCKKCPFGHKFGKDTDDFEDCDDCEIWDKCVKCE